MAAGPTSCVAVQRFVRRHQGRGEQKQRALATGQALDTSGHGGGSPQGDGDPCGFRRLSPETLFRQQTLPVSLPLPCLASGVGSVVEA